MGQGLWIIGGGKMGEALGRGILGQGAVQPHDMVVVETNQGRREELAQGLAGDFPGVEIAERPEAGRCSQAILVTKPGGVPGAAAAVAAAADGRLRVISVAAGVRSAVIAEALPEGAGVLRAMPNTPALVGAGATGLYAGAGATAEDLAWARQLLSAVGRVEVLADEELLDAVTGLSGSGPAYVFALAEALADAGVAVGLPRETAEALSAQTILGAGLLLTSSTKSAGELRSDVTSPNGTTAAGLGALGHAGFAAAVAAAVKAATGRSAEMGRADP